MTLLKDPSSPLLKKDSINEKFDLSNIEGLDSGNKIANLQLTNFKFRPSITLISKDGKNRRRRGGEKD